MTFGPGLFRFCLAGAVLLSHLSRWDFGRPAVMIFFALSGYWVAKMQDGAHRLPIPVFYLSRILRISPALVVTALVTFLAYSAANMPEPGSLKSTLLLLGLATRRDDIVGTIWSLDIELQFYILLPLVLGAKSWFDSPIKLIGATAVLFGLGLHLYLVRGLATVFLYAPMFAVGLSTYLHRTNFSFGLVIGSLTLGLGVISLVVYPAFGLHNQAQVIRDIIFMAAAMLFIPFVSWNVSQSGGSRDRLMGDLSYPLYLVQEPCIQIAQYKLGQFEHWKFAGLLLVISTTAILYWFIDFPVEKFRRRLFSDRSQLQHA